jgi:hypothetical protein
MSLLISLHNDSDPMIYLSGLGQFLFDVCLYGFVSHDHGADQAGNAKND